MLGERAWGVGAGFHVAGGGSLDWPKNWAGATRIQTVTQTVYIGVASAGIELVKGLKLGGKLLYYRGTEELVQQINFVSSQANASLGLAGGAFTFGASLQLEIPGSPLVFAVDYKHQGPLTLKGHAHFENVPAAYQPTLQDQGVTEQLRVPNELFVGLSLRPPEVPGLQVMGSWSLERWSVYVTDLFQGDKGFSVDVPRNYNNAWVLRLGVEYATAFHPPLTLRLGGQRSFSPQPTDTISPSLSDANSWGISGGFGYRLDPLLDGLRVDFGYQYNHFDRVTATGLDAFPGSYDTTAHLASLGVVWRAK
jgi:long-chain fatty acid transport protein